MWHMGTSVTMETCTLASDALARSEAQEADLFHHQGFPTVG